MKRTKIKPISKKKKRQIVEEKEIRQQLQARCQGRCELCGGDGGWLGLHPHEEVFRSHGGVMSLGNSKMLCQVCHSRKHGLKVIM